VSDGESASFLDWYGDAVDELKQGDLLFDFPLVVAVSGGDEHVPYEFESRQATVVVLTQSCDIPKRAQYSVMVAEVHEYARLIAAGNDHLKKRDYKQALSRGLTVSDFLLPPAADRMSWSIANFRDVHMVPKELAQLRFHEGSALRLVSPYREYLSQAFARFIMRVGLPSTLAQFERLQ
jgi:hypothetical protein